MSLKIVWQDFDYLEGVRYLALNWTQDQCNRHELRRLLEEAKPGADLPYLVQDPKDLLRVTRNSGDL